MSRHAFLECSGVSWPACPRCDSRDVWHGNDGHFLYRLHCYRCGLKDTPREYTPSLMWGVECEKTA